ncbi:MAG: hydantoinase/oxoprolinase family protein [Methylotenera sp.]|nr:hydantoinase/oxoprolinase family protein [Methylotenera sp.]
MKPAATIRDERRSLKVSVKATKSNVIGWDVGGAHLKAALLDGNGQLQQVLQVACPLWRGLHELEAAIDIVLNTFAINSALHAVTMTGELVDLFANRKEGVEKISRVMQAKLNDTIFNDTSNMVKFYTGALEIGFVSVEDVDDYWQHIASANWLASASFVATKIQYGLMMDVGSTTSDFVLLENNKPVCLGFTDADRMQSEALVYTGVVRTPLMAVAQKVKFKNETTSVAAEFFATSADVYRLTGDLQAEDDMADAADGQEKTQLASARRIARMIGHDVEDATMMDWIALAYQFKLQQMARLQSVSLAHISRIPDHIHQQSICLVGAGAGSFLVREIAQALDIQYVDVADLITQDGDDGVSQVIGNVAETQRWASVCLPAYAVAHLAYNRT